MNLSEKKLSIFHIICFILAIFILLLVGFYPSLCNALYIAFLLLFITLYAEIFSILKINKLAKIKAYYKNNSLLEKYFSGFVVARLFSVFIALCGSFALFFMLLFPSGSDIFLLCILVPIIIYLYRIINSFVASNVAVEFAYILAKKYSVLVCAVIACIAAFALTSYPQIDDLQIHFNNLKIRSNVDMLDSRIWQNLFEFFLFKKAVLDFFVSSIDDKYLYTAVMLMYAIGNFSAFASFCLLVLSYKNAESKADSSDSKTLNSVAFRRFFAMLFFLIFLYIAFNISIYLQPLAKSHASVNSLISPSILQTSQHYIQISLEGSQRVIKSTELDSLIERINKKSDEFKNILDEASLDIIEQYFLQKDRIIDEYSKWYFSVYGEYARLFYSSLGKAEEYAQEEFIKLLKIHSPYSLEEKLESMYARQFDSFKKQINNDFMLFSSVADNKQISQQINIDSMHSKLDLLSPRASDGVAAIFTLSTAGVMILKASGKSIAKTTGKIIGKSVAKKGSSALSGIGSSLMCGYFAPLCAIGVFVASDFAINSIDEALNEKEFKQKMHDGFNEFESKLKNSLQDYNTQLIADIKLSILNSLKNKDSNEKK